VDFRSHGGIEVPLGVTRRYASKAVISGGASEFVIQVDETPDGIA
jgi:hypothetical protein